MKALFIAVLAAVRQLLPASAAGAADLEDALHSAPDPPAP